MDEAEAKILEKKARIWKFVTVFCVIAGFTAGCFFLFRSLGLLDKNRLNQTIADKGIWVYVIFICLFILQAVCLFMMPGNIAVFIGVGWLLFDSFWVALVMCVIGVWLASMLLFCLGRYAGRNVLYWLFNKEKLERSLEWVTQKGTTKLPALFLIPFMPNDLLCVACGASKLTFWAFLLIIIPCRAVETLLMLCYPYVGQFFITGRDIRDVLMFFNLVIVDIVLIVLYYRALVKLFRKTILRKKYVAVEKPYLVEEEVPEQ
ncbi:MAG: VTT domain-containing protein [Firmicutes bacterium]|nr:VTT domain-containing protein [Bacillota bacterium]